MRWVGVGLLSLLAVAAAPASAQDDTRVLDDFGDAKAWRATASDEVKAEAVPSADGGLCLRYDFGRVSGYAVLRRAVAIDLPARYGMTLRLRGSGASNTLQMKFVDASGDNVWWLNRPGFSPPAASTDLRVRQRDIVFAWGPTADRNLHKAAGIELVVASGQGGRGELCFERLSLTTLPPPGPQPTPVVTASADRAEAAAAFDGKPETAWRPARAGQSQWQVDFGEPRELNGVLLRWADGARASDADLQFSDDGRQWRTVHRVRGSRRDLLPIWLPDSQTRHLRLQLRGGPKPRYALAELKAMSAADWPTADGPLRTLAQAEPRGRFPRAYAGEQNYWTLVGVDGGGTHAALLSEDGAIEPRKAGPSLEPFLIDEGGGVTSWADAQIEHRQRDGYLPLPDVRWTAPGVSLRIEAGADGPREQPALIARYTVTNTSDRPRRLSLALVLRPWQVNPPQQFLNTPGGVAPVQRMAWQDGALQVDGRPWLRPAQTPGSVGAAAFDQGDPLALAAAGALPALRQPVEDPQGLGGAALRWPLVLAPGASRSVSVVLPLADGAVPALTDEQAGARLDAIADHWRERLNRVRFTLPPEAQPLVDTLRASLAQILLSRDGPALQPGTRSYARTWVRDGAMMVAGLLRLGEVDAARDFVQWYAGHLFANGKVPCCVDARGADPVAENDSHGQFIYAVAELWRHTRDRALLASLWPQVDAAARYMETLRQSERTAANRTGERAAFYGLMPASISHEGYSAKPMHAYWDDFWALAGYRDAADLAGVMGLADRAGELAGQRDQFRADLVASLKLAMQQHKIDFLPGAAELGDFDPSSSTLVFSPAGAETDLPRAALEATWERYWRESVARRDGQRDWVDYTPYELRSVSALLRLGWPDRAHAMLDFFLRDQRPSGWHQWAEVVGRQPREPRFLGDMPHAWISSDFIRSALDLLAYERESDGALVLGAGVPAGWWRAGPVGVVGLKTPWGDLSWRLETAGADRLRLVIHPGLSDPPGGLWFAWFASSPPPAADADGRALSWQGRLLRLPAGGSELLLPQPPP